MTTQRPTQWFLLRGLAPYVRPYRRWLIAAILATGLGGALGLGFPWVLGSLVDSALDPAAGPSQLTAAAVALLVIFGAQALLAAARIYCLAYAGQHIVNNLRSALFNTLIRLPMGFLDRRSPGSLTARLMSDASFAYGAASGAGPQLVYAAVTVTGGAVLMVLIDPLLALLVLALLPVAWLMARRFGSRMRNLSHGYQNGLAATNALAGDSLAAARVVKSFSAESTAAARYHRSLQAVIDQGMQRARARTLWTPLSTFVTGFGIVAVVWVGGRQVQGGALTAGALVSFLLYARFVADGTATLVTQYSRLAQATGASERVLTLLAEPREPLTAAGTVIPERTGGVEFRDVSFTYPTRRAGVLHDVSFDVPAGSTVALVGRSGAGKSTIGQLITRLYNPDSGTVLVDGVDVQQQSLPDLRRSIAVVPQDALLLSGSIADNIRLGKPGATREEVAAAARAANADSFITAFPRGYATPVGDRGTALSGGQRQRIAIARALLADPRLLILDEATNALDPQTEALVSQAVARLMAGRTNIVIAHRISTVLAADHVVVLHEGRVVEQGPPQDLLGGNGHFRRLAQADAVGLLLDPG